MILADRGRLGGLIASRFVIGGVRKTNTKDKMKLQMKQDPLVRAMKAAYRKSWSYKLDRLQKERSRWLRKQSIATNKLLQVDSMMRELAGIMAMHLDGIKEIHETA